MARPIVKYLDPISGEYEFATVVDVGDLRDLNTTIKSDIVGAINSIISDGVHNPINDEKIEDLERIINSLKDGTFKIDDFGSIDEYLKQQFLDELDKINEKNREEIQSVLTQLDTSVDDAIKDYQEKVAAQNIILENAENTLADARDTLEAKAAELETANIGFSELETEFNELDNYISTNVRTIDFDNFNAMVEDYETVVTQTSDEVGVDMSGSTLSYLTGRVSDAEANISAQADEITSKMSYDEFQYMPVPKYNYGENLLFDTFDFGDAWNGKNGAQVTTDTFLFGKVVAFNSPTGLYETLTDDLTIGESYVFSTYVNVQPSEKSPSQDKYEPISKSYDPTDFKIQIGGKSFSPGVYEDLSGINGWVRINQEFVADAVNPIISITPTGVNSQSEVAYMAMPKVEKGLTVTPWQPHVEDNYATLSSTQSMIKQQANSITAFVTEVSELDDSYKQATSTFKMLADGFAANTEAVEAYEDAVTRYGTEYSNINGKFEQKVWKDDFDAIIEDINIDNRNRVLNSDFIRSEISSSDRRLSVEDWSLNSDWELKTIDNDEYLSRNRTGLVQNLITSASSNYFPVRDGERILFGFDLIHSGLDNDKVFAIELFDISNRRLLKQEFSLSSLTKVGNRYHGSFNISTPGAEKGSVVLQLPKNGSVSFTKISFQNADIGSVDWSPAPEDSWIIQSKLATYISQVEDEITIGGTGQKIDTLTGLLTEDKGTFTLNPDKIATEVLNSQTYDDMGFVNKTNFEQTADGWMQEITSEGRLAGYINASPDTYRISFDKIMLEGTTWADALGSSKITVTENFALLGKNGRPVLDVNNDGSINMNVTSLKIGEYNALTTDDKSDIESEVADKVIKTTEPYIHIAYADTEDGQGISFNPSGKQYIGFAKSHLPTPSGTASNYEWSKYVGADGYEGADGVGIKSTTIRYASSTSGTSQPSTGWSSTIPTVEPGNYLWTEIVWTYTNSEKKQSYTVARIGADGKDGVVGKDGVGIKSTTITYGLSANETTQPATYTGTVPTLVKGQYLWTKTVWVYTDNTTETGYTKTYIAKDGNSGTNGLPGKDGVGITKTTITYAKSSSGTTAPKTGYTTTVPSANPGEFVWTKTVWTYTDNTTETGYSVGKIGNTGATGANGKDGVAGKDGVGIQKTEIHYASSTSGTTRPSTGWNLAVPSVSPGNYLWTRTTWTYTDRTIEEGYSVSRIGKDGNTGKDGIAGKDGVGIKSTVINYATSSSGTTKPTSGWTPTVPSVTPGNYLWTRTVWTYTDNDTEEGYSVSRIGKDGINGTNGTNGKDGTGIKSAVISYVIHTNGTTAPTLGWVSTVPTPVKGKYLWTRTITTYTDNTTSTTYSVAYQATDGQRGETGATGTGVSSTAVTYAQTTSGTTTPTSWSSTRPAPIKGQYLWSRTIITYTNGSSSTAYNTSYSATDGQKGDKGDTGEQGPQGPRGATGSQGPRGNTGTSVESITEYYLATSVSSGILSTNTGFTTTMQPLTATNKYLWNYEKINFSDGTSQPTIPVVIGVYGDKGQTGGTGATGRSIVSITEHYLATSASSGVTRSTSGWSTTMQPTTETNRYLWNYETIKWSSGTTTTYVEPIIIGVHGAKGPQGEQGPQGIKGANGSNGQSQWVHVRYSVNSNGSGMTTSPSGTTKYVGIAVTNSATAPAYTGFTWSKYVGENGVQGPQGVPGKNGANGTTTYTWVKYADTPTSEMSNFPEGKKYIGLAFNKTTQTESNNNSDYQWSLMPQNIDIGGRNLLRNSDKKVSNGTYNIASYDLTDEIKEGEEVTLTIWGSLAATKSYFSAYNSGGSVNVATLTNNGNGTYSRTFKWKIGSSTNTFLNVYAFTNAQTGVSTINKIKLEKGNVTTDWTPAPEDVAASIKAAQDKANAASQAAIAAQSDATVGKNMADNLSNDSIITQVEKLELKREWDAIVKEKPSITTQATDYALQGSTEATNYNAAYTALNGSIPSLLTNMKVTSTVARATFNNNFANYYDRRQLLLNRIAKKAKELADVAQSSIDNLEIGGRNLIINKDIVTGIYLQNQNGATASASTHATTGFIPVTPSSNYTLSTSPPKNLTQMRVVYYTSAKVYISGILYSGNQGSIKQITTPSNAAFVRWSGDNATSSKLTEWMFEKGNKASSWTPSPEDIEASYTAVAQAKAEAERVKAQTYADGKVSDEEKARIKDADAKLAAAKKYAVDQILSDKTIKDTRNDNQTPSWYYTNHPRRTIKEFKLTATIGVVSSEGTYGILETEIPWNDASGGPVKQTFRVNSKTFKRSGTTTSWSSWVSYDDIAETAKSIADSAKASASTANSLLTDIASDSKLTATEKKAAKKEWDIIVGEKPKIDTSANTYGITTEKTAYNTAYSTLNNYLSGLLANLNTTSNIVGTTFRSNFRAYYNARQDLLNKIADSAKSLVDEIEVGGRNYFTTESPISAKIPGGGFVVRGPETPNGFKITGRNGGDTSLRINNVITSNGWWTVSFDIRGAQTAYVSVSVDINDKGSTVVRTNNTNTYERKSVSVYVDNYSETVHNFVDFDNFGWAYYLIDNIKVEKGNKATDWTPAPEDVVADINKRVYNPVRYIRDWSNGSTANNGNHWYELMAIDEHGNNRALNRTVTSNGAGSNFPHLTNGVTAIGTYASATNSEGAVYLQVDLGQIYYNIVEIKVWKYYNDGRTYKENKTEVSSDGVTWYPIYDYTVEGEYTPTAEGKSIPNTIAKTHSILTGSGTKNLIDLKANAERVKAEAYADGKVSAEEKKRITDAENKYRKALILSRASSGKLMNSDPNFSKNIEEFAVYNNAKNGNVAILYEDVSSSTGPSGVTRRLRVTTTGTASPTWGGIVASPAFQSRVNAEYVIRFTALLPKGRSFYQAQNAMGTGSTTEWLTSTEGTGNWEEYAYYYKCGSTGTFSNFGHLYVLGGATPTTASPLIWYLDKYEALDISNVTGNPSQESVDSKASAEDLTNVSNDLNTAIGDLSNTVDGKVDKSLYEEFLEHNANIQEQLSTSTANAQEDITKALARTATVEQKLGEGAADWIFTHTKIRMSDDGITLGSEGSGSYLQITNDQISFYNGSKDPVAFINGGMLNINHAIFVESIQISEFMFSSEAPGHLTLRYVGN